MNIIEIINAFSVFFALKTIRTIANHNCPKAPKKSIENSRHELFNEMVCKKTTKLELNLIMNSSDKKNYKLNIK